MSDAASRRSLRFVAGASIVTRSVEHRPSADSPRATQLYAIAAIVLGVGAGIFSPEPATALTLVAAGVASGGFLVAARTPRSTGQLPVTSTLAVGIAANILIVMVAPPVADWWFRPLVAVMGAAALFPLVTQRFRTPILILLVVGQLCVWWWMISHMDPPEIDVYLFQQEASEALLEGSNPYELRYVNLYGDGSELYAPEVQKDGFLRFGFPYPPLSLLMASPGYAVGGDYRYAAAVASAGTGLLLAFMARGSVAAGMAAVFVLSPLTLRVIFNGWTEPFVGVLLAGTVYTASRAPRIAPVLLGFLLASKQYLLPLLLPATVLLTLVRNRAGCVRMNLLSVGVAAVTVLPFLAWNPDEFVRSVLLLQAAQPFRPDSVGVAGAIARLGLLEVPAWAAFAGGALTLVATTAFAPRTPSGFASVTAMSFLVFFLLSKQAFMNYYYVVLVALACCVAAAAAPPARGTVSFRTRQLSTVGPP